MRSYYYADNGQQFGPFTFEELTIKKLRTSTLVWTDGLEQWVRADSIDELKDCLVSVPPPLRTKHPKYDSTYTKPINATLIGLLLFFIPIFQILFDFYPQTTGQKTILILSAIVIRIPICIWVQKIAFQQKRNSTVWGLIAFFFPAITLIVVSLSNKLLPSEEALNTKQKKLKELYEKGQISFDTYNNEWSKL